MDKKVYSFLTFNGNTEEVVSFYTEIIPNSKIVSIIRIGENDPGETGKILNCVFELSGQTYIAMDMEKNYAPPFDWAFSLYYECSNEEEFDTIFNQLSKDGTIIMGPEPIMTEKIKIRKGTWVTDRFGVTWQLMWM